MESVRGTLVSARAETRGTHACFAVKFKIHMKAQKMHIFSINFSASFYPFPPITS